MVGGPAKWRLLVVRKEGLTRKDRRCRAFQVDGTSRVSDEWLDFLKWRMSLVLLPSVLSGWVNGWLGGGLRSWRAHGTGENELKTALLKVTLTHMYRWNVLAPSQTPPTATALTLFKPTSYLLTRDQLGNLIIPVHTIRSESVVSPSVPPQPSHEFVIPPFLFLFLFLFLVCFYNWKEEAGTKNLKLIAFTTEERLSSRK